MSAANGGCGFVSGGLNLTNTNGSKSNHQHKDWRQVEMRNLTYDFRERPLMERSERGGVGLESGCVFHPRSVLSGSSVEPDNTNGSKSNHQHKEVSGVRLKCAT